MLNAIPLHLGGLFRMLTKAGTALRQLCTQEWSLCGVDQHSDFSWGGLGKGSTWHSAFLTSAHQEGKLVLWVLWVRSSTPFSGRALARFHSSLAWSPLWPGTYVSWDKQGFFGPALPSCLGPDSHIWQIQTCPSEVEEGMTEIHQQEWKENIVITSLYVQAHYLVTVWIHYSSITKATTVLWIAPIHYIISFLLKY